MQVKINNVWVKMQRANNNQWPYYNTNGPWQTGFPMPIRISSIAGEVGTLLEHTVCIMDLCQGMGWRTSLRGLREVPYTL